MNITVTVVAVVAVVTVVAVAAAAVGAAVAVSEGSTPTIVFRKVSMWARMVHRRLYVSKSSGGKDYSSRKGGNWKRTASITWDCPLSQAALGESLLLVFTVVTCYCCYGCYRYCGYYGHFYMFNLAMIILLWLGCHHDY